MNQPPLFKRDPVTIEGYVPRFTYAECLMEFTVVKVPVSSRLYSCDDIDPYHDRNAEPRYNSTYTIKIAGHTIQGSKDEFFYSKYPSLENVAHICNEFLAYKPNEQKHPEAWVFLTDNAVDLNNSKRYWSARQHLHEVSKLRLQLEELKVKIERAEYVASINAVGVLEERTLSYDERQKLWADFSGGLPFV